MAGGDIFSVTLQKLRKYGLEHEGIVVAFSTGKDSLAVLDLCSKVFQKVVAYFLYTVPNISYEDKILNWARERYGITIIEQPHPTVISQLRDGVFCNPMKDLADCKEFPLNAPAYAVMELTGITLHAGGEKRGDFNARMMSCNQVLNFLKPLAAWKDYDVYAYLKTHDIPVPDSLGDKTNATRLTTEVILWLYDSYREDYDRIRKVFPYVEAVVHRREMFGFTGNYNKLMQQRQFNNRGAAK